ncbi:cation:proton antiporter [Saccharicrinis sp. FJH54]|uniref:cation:proton antiporter domain-containing protein n=1 Tax=Saccharicrinis sp. FJH54 TaxID=3344665 RepID=UPI0035D509FE
MPFLVTEINPVFSNIVLLSMVIIAAGFIFNLLKQPSIISYILVGILVGPHVFGLITNEALISDFGSLGLVLLLFFLGMELSLDSLIKNWKLALIGTLFQIIFSILAIAAISSIFDWNFNKIIIFGFLISLSSTAVIIKVLESRKEIETKVGQQVIAILLAQDILIVPMMLSINYMGGDKPEMQEIILQAVGSVFIIGILAWIFYKKHIKLPFEKLILRDHELQVFIAFFICFGFSILTAIFHLSAALGAFVAGIIVASSRSTHWVHSSLHAFHIIFVAMFFVSIGLMLDISFFLDNYMRVIILVVTVLVINNIINGVVFKIFKAPLCNSIYAGSLLAQIGEFSFIIGATAHLNGILNNEEYQIIISAITLSLIVSPFWISLIHRLFRKRLSACNF